MLMFYGWPLFSYSKRMTSEGDRLSHCKRKIDSLSQPLFLDDPEDKIFLFTSASRKIELLIFKKEIEIRLLLWYENRTENIVLFKREFNSIEMEAIEKSIVFENVEIGFFNTEDLKSFITFIQRDKNQNLLDRENLKFNKTFKGREISAEKEALFLNRRQISQYEIFNRKEEYNNSGNQTVFYSQFRTTKDCKITFLKSNIVKIEKFISEMKYLTGQIVYSFDWKIRVNSKEDFINQISQNIHSSRSLKLE